MKGLTVEYNKCGYRHVGGINEFGDREIEDYHYQSFGTVLTEHGHSALVWFHKNVDNHHQTTEKIIEQSFVEWVSKDSLIVINK